MKRSIGIAVVLFPIIVMAGWLSSLFLQRANGTKVELKIMGYDPRDLLSGHYFTYRVDFSPTKVCDKKPYTANYCVCLEPSDVGPATVSWEGDCSHSERSCPVYLRGECKWNGFVAGIERFYIPETYHLPTVPPNATIKVSISKNGIGQVLDLLVNGKPLSETMKK